MGRNLLMMALTAQLICRRAREQSGLRSIKSSALWIFVASTLIAHSALAQFDVDVSSDGVTILGYYGETADVIVPGTINGIAVRKIGRAAFEKNWNLRTVDLPDGLEEIQENAFFECRNLVTVRIPSSVNVIGARAFAWCNLTSLTLPPGLKRIALATYQHNTALLTVIVPGSVESIEDLAFHQNDNLKVVTFSPGLKIIGASAFFDCPSIQTIEIPDTVGKIGDFAFSRCRSLTQAKIGSGVQSIGMQAFSGCDLLSDVKLGEGLESIGDNAFGYSMALRRIELPASLRALGDGLVGGCPLLREIAVREGNLTFTSAGGALYSKDLSRLIKVPEGIGGTFVVSNGVRSIATAAVASPKLVDILLPDSVEEIGQAAFAGSGLRKMVVPHKVRTIGPGAFSGCTALTNIVLNQGVQSLGEGVFSSCAALRSLIVPNSVEIFGPRMFTWAGIDAVLFAGAPPAFSGPFSADSKQVVPIFRLPSALGWQGGYWGNPIRIWNASIRVRSAKIARESGTFTFEVDGDPLVPFAIQEMTIGEAVWKTSVVSKMADAPWRFVEPQQSTRPGKLFRVTFP